MTLGNSIFSQRVFINGSATPVRMQVFQPLVANECLGKFCDAVNHALIGSKTTAALGAEHEIKVSQADVEINHDNASAHLEREQRLNAAVDVVLPTPPLPDVTTKTCATSLPFIVLVHRRDS